MKVVLVNRFFYPDHAPTGLLAADVAFHLAAAGIEVHAVTSRQHYDRQASVLPPFERIRDVSIHRVAGTRFGRRTLLGRILDYLTFYVAATVRLLTLLARGDVVIAKTDPPLLSVCAALAGRLRGAKLVNWQQDVFPEAAAPLGFPWLGGVFGAPVRALRAWSLRAASANVVLGELMRKRLIAVGADPARTHVIANWADGTRIRPIDRRESKARAAWARDDQFVVGYAGNIGRAHEFDTVLRACERLRDRSDVVFVFVGGGQQRAEIEDAVRSRRLDNVCLASYVPEENLADMLAAFDVHLVSLLPALEGLILPSKFYGIAAAGRPVIYVGDPDGEVPQQITKYAIGHTVRVGDVGGFVAAVLSLRDDPSQARAMGMRAREAFESHWDKPHAMRLWERLVRDIVSD